MTIPPLVVCAQAAAAQQGFTRGCRDGDGALLHVIAGSRGIARVAEIGTGAGVGTAWLASALAPGVRLYTAEWDATLAAAAAALFAEDKDVRVLEGDWRRVLPAHAPFDLVFVGAGEAKDDPDAVLGIAAPGATLVLDDFSAGAAPDPRRDRWLTHRRLASVMLGTGGDAVALVAVVRR